MTESEAVSGLLVLGLDTCGPTGTVALARVGSFTPPKQSLDGAPDGSLEILGQMELAGRTYSSTLISSVEGLLTGAGFGLKDVGTIVVVHGPGSFTGVRVGLSAVKGLAEPGRIPVVAVSRLAVLAAKAEVGSAALDAHRHEVFLRVESDGEVRELLAGTEEISHISKARYGAPGVVVSLVPQGEGPLDKLRAGSGAPGGFDVSQVRTHGPLPHKQVCGDPGPGAPSLVAVCDEAAAEMVASGWNGVEMRRVEAPTAADAIRLCVPAILAGEFADLATLDGHYLRRSDAEIFGEKAKGAGEEKGSGVRVRRMEASDIDAVMEIAGKTDHAPVWGRAAYEAAVDQGNQPRRVALVAERDGGLAGFVVAAVLPGGEAELESVVTAAPHQRHGVARELFASLKHELRRQGVREVMLEVREGNRSALGFYRFLGFREEGRRPGYYAAPVEDAVLMRLRLS
ncbi:tRNA (adenosine(37)-N6)-threonylcarbamoyltransferase complex dimerization subunit type 1 TsaB [Occallatibacter savannae]|uniref:tRNA (adenosine(37)-N6)-threonylcarbamoyltransferase complex dimerization subunit type 1 TsaB n=1 Tax=Occallatibacter savannae TaxID=1002691 RepID=UPI000D68CABD|nr:tRNA (adenosine(37)-N6)-threonylcarbamoyltransferase complex dimerization subunit type 1 TsaB [Occallatibacter savannae]